MYYNLQWLNADHTGILANDGVLYIPTDPNNTDYQEIMRLVDAGELTIADPD